MERFTTPLSHESSSWDYTEEILLKDPVDERHQIGRDVRIDGGVYEGGHGEAIVVDQAQYPYEYEVARRTIRERMKDLIGPNTDEAILRVIYHYTQTTLPYNKDASNRIFSIMGHDEVGARIPLNVYVGSGGVCRHQALFAGALIEQCIDEGLLSGQVSIERNRVKKPDGKLYGHAWVRYTKRDGTILIIDVTKGNFDSLDNLACRPDPEFISSWDYARPTDKILDQNDAWTLQGGIYLPSSAPAIDGLE